MESNQSIKEQALEILKKFLCGFKPCNAWCYDPRPAAAESDNLLHLFGLPLNELESLFKAADVLNSTGSRMKHTTMETLVTSIDNAEYLKYRGTRYLKLGEGVWNMDLQSSAKEKRRAPHLSMS
jgi:hypothetical protein